jgi:hypothetical protein
LVMIAPSAAHVPAFSGYFENTSGDQLGVMPPQGGAITTGTGSTLVSGTDLYIPFLWITPMLVKRASFRVATAYTGGTPVSNLFARIYAQGSNGRPSKLLYDFGVIGSAGTSLNSTGNISSGTSGNGFFLNPGEYWLDFLPIFSGGTTGPAMSANTATYTALTLAKYGMSSMVPNTGAQSTGGSSTTPDPANVSGYTLEHFITQFVWALSSS